MSTNDGTICGYPVHPAAGIWPLMSDAELNDLTDDIRRVGLRDPIDLLDGAVLDGRNRLLACSRAGVEPRFVDWSGDDPASYVWSRGMRRNLTREQIAMAAAKRANLPRGRQPANPAIEGFTQAAAAKQGGVSLASVERAASVIKLGVPELTEAVERGDVALSAAAEVAHLPAAEQRAAVAEGPKAVTQAAKKARAERKPTPADTTPAREPIPMVDHIREAADAVRRIFGPTGVLLERLDWLEKHMNLAPERELVKLTDALGVVSERAAEWKERLRLIHPSERD